MWIDLLRKVKKINERWNRCLRSWRSATEPNVPIGKTIPERGEVLDRKPEPSTSRQVELEYVCEEYNQSGTRF